MLDFMQIMQRFRTQQIADLGEKYNWNISFKV